MPMERHEISLNMYPSYDILIGFDAENVNFSGLN